MRHSAASPSGSQTIGPRGSQSKIATQSTLTRLRWALQQSLQALKGSRFTAFKGFAVYCVPLASNSQGATGHATISSLHRNSSACSTIEPAWPWVRRSVPGVFLIRQSPTQEGWNMRALPTSLVFRRQALGLPTAAALDEERLKIGAALAWIRHYGNLEDFPGSRSERMALMTTAIRRGLAAWDRGQDCYKLTKLGKMQAARCLPPAKGAKTAAQDSRVAKSDLGARLLDRFERHPHTLIGAFFAIGVAVGAAAAWAPSSGPSGTRSALPARTQTSDSPAAAKSSELSAPGSPVSTPPEHPQAAGVPAEPTPAAPSRGKVVSTGGPPEPVAAQETQAADPTLPAPVRQENERALISGSVAATRAAGHFDRSPSADVAQPSASTAKLLDSEPMPELKGAPQTQLRRASHHRVRDAKTQHTGAAAAGERARSWSPDDGDRTMLAPQARRDPNAEEDSIARRAPRHHQSRHVTPNFDREPYSTRDDPMGLVGWLSYY
jgi:hypothetical protein